MPSPDDGGSRTWVGRWTRRARRPLTRLFQVTPEGREAIALRMLSRRARETAFYWLQLVLAMAIATLGLVLGSDAVVIGAMLISPLMGPIVELGMGLAVGSPVLVVRSAWRVAVSVAVVVSNAALITLALPFHEMTTSIASRISPTVLDLLIAICCALVAAFATALSNTSAATTAAGTAIAIALVPPLCVVGFGIGTHEPATMRGAGLLFTANFCAIVLFAVLTFIALGFGEIDVVRVERAAAAARDAEGPVADGRARGLTRLHGLLGSSSGVVLRVGMPLLLVGLVYLPLRHALEEVAWEVQVRQAVQRRVDALGQDAVSSSFDAKDHRVRIRLVVVGSPERAQTLERDLERQISAIAGVVPAVQVVAVMDASAIRRAIDASRVPLPVEPARPDLQTVPARIAASLARRWPAEQAGPLVSWRLEITPDGACVALVHDGRPLAADARQILGTDLSDAAGQAVCIRDEIAPGDRSYAAAADAGASADAVAGDATWGSAEAALGDAAVD